MPLTTLFNEIVPLPPSEWSAQAGAALQTSMSKASVLEVKQGLVIRVKEAHASSWEVVIRSKAGVASTLLLNSLFVPRDPPARPADPFQVYGSQGRHNYRTGPFCLYAERQMHSEIPRSSILEGHITLTRPSGTGPTRKRPAHVIYWIGSDTCTGRKDRAIEYTPTLESRAKEAGPLSEEFRSHCIAAMLSILPSEEDEEHTHVIGSLSHDATNLLLIDHLAERNIKHTNLGMCNQAAVEVPCYTF